MLDAFPGVAGSFENGLVRLYPHILHCWLFQVVALATVKLLSTQCSEKPYKLRGGSTRGDRLENIGRRNEVIPLLFWCRWLWRSRLWRKRLGV